MARTTELDAAAERFALAYDRTGLESSRVNCLYYMLLSEVAKDEENDYDTSHSTAHPLDNPSFGTSRFGTFAGSERPADGASGNWQDALDRDPG